MVQSYFATHGLIIAGFALVVMVISSGVLVGELNYVVENKIDLSRFVAPSLLFVGSMFCCLAVLNARTQQTDFSLTLLYRPLEPAPFSTWFLVCFGVTFVAAGLAMIALMARALRSRFFGRRVVATMLAVLAVGLFGATATGISADIKTHESVKLEQATIEERTQVLKDLRLLAYFYDRDASSFAKFPFSNPNKSVYKQRIISSGLCQVRLSVSFDKRSARGVEMSGFIIDRKDDEVAYFNSAIELSDYMMPLCSENRAATDVVRQHEKRCVQSAYEMTLAQGWGVDDRVDFAARHCPER